MIRLPHDIKRLVLVVMIPLLLALTPAMAQTVVYQGTTTSLSVVEVPGHACKWELYSDATVNFATVPGNCPVTSAIFTGGNAGSSVRVTWLQPGNYFFKVTSRDAFGCAMNLKIGMIKVVSKEILIVLGFEETIIGACQSVKLDASKSIGDNLKYEWSLPGPGGSLTQQTGMNTEFRLSPTYMGSLPADFKVRLHITDNAGNSKSDTINITVDRLPVVDISSSGKLERDGSMMVEAIIMAGSVSDYNWHTSKGHLIGPVNQPSARLLGAGIYTVDITDRYGCMSAKDFRFPIEIDQFIAKPDYARISWARDTTINVLENDRSTVDLNPATVQIIRQPALGTTKVNVDGSITYVPKGRVPGRDEFEYEVCDVLNLCASAWVTIDIYDSELLIPEAFSPNGDGINDLFIFNGLGNYLQSQLYVYTRSGILVYQSSDYQNNWDGIDITSAMTGPQYVPTGIYYYILKLGGTNRSIKGFVYIGY